MVKMVTILIWNDIIIISSINKVLYNNDNIVNNPNTTDINKDINISINNIIIIHNTFGFNNDIENTKNIIITRPTSIYDK